MTLSWVGSRVPAPGSKGLTVWTQRTGPKEPDETLGSDCRGLRPKPRTAASVLDRLGSLRALADIDPLPSLGVRSPRPGLLLPWARSSPWQMRRMTPTGRQHWSCCQAEQTTASSPTLQPFQANEKPETHRAQVLSCPWPWARWVGKWKCQSLSHVWPFVTPWTVAHQAPLSMGFSGQEYYSGLPHSPPGKLLNPGREPKSLMSPELAGGGFFTTSTTWEASQWSKPVTKYESTYMKYLKQSNS